MEAAGCRVEAVRCGQHEIGLSLSLGNTVALTTERLVAPVQGMHRAIAGRWFGVVGAPATPVRVVHDAIADVAYGAVRLGGTAVGAGLDYRVRLSPAASDKLQSVVNGLWGDGLAHRDHKLGIVMTTRDRTGSAIPIELAPTWTRSAVTGRIVILVHGLMDTERCWQGSPDHPGLTEVLEQHRALTPLAVRYNTGLRISHNGKELAALLDRLHTAWPVPVESIALVGHSMGGLVIRSACATAASAGHAWLDDVSDVVALGSPHRGAPLEKLVNIVSWGLGATQETRPLARFLNGRSVGIKDLRFGAVADDDWEGRDPDALLIDTVGDHRLPAGIQHHFVAGVVTADPSHPVGVAMGDLLVRTPSGAGGRNLEPTNVVVVGRTRHGDLRNDPVVIDQVIDWLDPSAD